MFYVCCSLQLRALQNRQNALMLLQEDLEGRIKKSEDQSADECKLLLKAVDTIGNCQNSYQHKTFLGDE